MKPKTKNPHQPIPHQTASFERGSPLPAGLKAAVRRQGPGRVEVLDDTRDTEYCGGVFSFIVLYTLSVVLGMGIMYMLLKAGILSC